jgi:hypothetical protein
LNLMTAIEAYANSQWSTLKNILNLLLPFKKSITYPYWYFISENDRFFIISCYISS